MKDRYPKSQNNKFEKSFNSFLQERIRRSFGAHLIALLWLVLLPMGSSAAVVTFTPTMITGSRWMYEYTVSATSGDPTIEEFTIYFDPVRYSDLAIASSPPGWDPLVISPDTSIPADGFFDALALIVGISPGTAQDGFAVSFNFLGVGTPGAQRFEIVDRTTFLTLGTGLTSEAIITPSPSGIPEPNSSVLAGLAFAFILIFHRRHLNGL